MQDGASFFCATPLAASLCGGTGAAADDTGGGKDSALNSSGYIIVETNFRVGEGLSLVCMRTDLQSCHVEF